MQAELDALIRLFEEAASLVEKELLRALSRNAKSTTRREKRERLAVIAAILAKLRSDAVGTEDSPGAAWEVVKSSYGRGSKRAIGDLRKAGRRPMSTDLASPGIHLDAVRTLYASLTDDLDQAILYAGKHADKTLRKATLHEVLVGQLAGRRGADTATALENNLASRGIRAFKDAKGREWKLGNYAKMAANYAASEASTTALLNRAAENGFDLVKVSEHPHKNDVCSKHEGRVFSISGTHPDYPELKEAPPYHPFCRHVLTIHVEALAA